MKDNSRTIGYIDDNEDPMDIEIELALKSSMEENIERFMKLIASLAAMSGVNIYELPKSRTIYYIEDGDIE